MFRQQNGVTSLLKEGYSHFTGNEETIYRCADAVSQLASSLKTCFGPTGTKKLLCNFIEKQFLTSSTIQIINELEILHPAVKYFSSYAKALHNDFDDAVGLFFIFGSFLLTNVVEQIQNGRTIKDVIEEIKYTKNTLSDIFEQMRPYAEKCFANEEAVFNGFKSRLTSRLTSEPEISDLVELLFPLLTTLSENFQKPIPENSIKLNSITSCSLCKPKLFNGVLMEKVPLTRKQNGTNLKVVVLGDQLIQPNIETSTTALMHNADSLKNLSNSEATELKKNLEKYKSAEIDVIVCGGSVSSALLQAFDQEGIICINTVSKFELQRIARAIDIPVIRHAMAPSSEEIGLINKFEVIELSNKLFTLIEPKNNRVHTIVFSNSTRILQQEYESTVNNLVSYINILSATHLLVNGAGSFEFWLSKLLSHRDKASDKSSKCGSKALLQVVEQLANNCGLNGLKSINKLDYIYKRDESDYNELKLSFTEGIVPFSTEQKKNSSEMVNLCPQLIFPVYDLFDPKCHALLIACEAVIEIISIDQIIIAKPAGGPKLLKHGHWDDQEDEEGFK